jgi:hypothetical protein
MSVPRWGIHQEIKYSPRRSILKVCPVCKEFFLQVSKGNKKYCSDICSDNAKKNQMKPIHQRFIQNRDKFEHANYMKDLYAEGKLSKSKWDVGTDNIPKPELNDDGGFDWDAYHQRLQSKLHRLGLA